MNGLGVPGWLARLARATAEKQKKQATRQSATRNANRVVGSASLKAQQMGAAQEWRKLPEVAGDRIQVRVDTSSVDFDVLFAEEDPALPAALGGGFDIQMATAGIHFPWEMETLRQDEWLATTLRWSCGDENGVEFASHEITWPSPRSDAEDDHPLTRAEWREVKLEVRGEVRKMKRVEDGHTYSLDVRPNEDVMALARQKGFQRRSCDWDLTEEFRAATHAWNDEGKLIARRKWGFVLRLRFDAGSGRGSGSVRYFGI